jgi:hypothetical protein
MSEGPKTYPAVPLPHPNFGMPELTKAEILAIKSLGSGTANEGQQKMALEVIVKKLGGTYEVCADPIHLPLHEGRRMPGSLIVQILSMTLREDTK